MTDGLIKTRPWCRCDSVQYALASKSQLAKNLIINTSTKAHQ